MILSSLKVPTKTKSSMTGIKKLQLQIKKLDTMLLSLQERDAKLFQRIVDATQKHDAQTSKVLGNELAEVRKVSKILSSARICIRTN